MRRQLESIGGLAALAVLGGALFAIVGGGPASGAVAGPVGPVGPVGAVGAVDAARAAGAAGPGAAVQPAAVTALAAPDQDPLAAGRQLYLETCASCHGPAGQGTNTGPSLANAGPATFDFYLRTGRMPLSAPGQPAYRQEVRFDEAQIQALIAYGSTLGNGPQIPQVVDTVPLQRGWQLYTQNCAACHGPAGGGGAIGAGNVAPALDRVDSTLVAEAMLVGPGVMPVFALPPDDLSAVGTYVEYLKHRPSPGGIDLSNAGPVPEGFIAGVVGLGLLVLIARWVGRSNPA
jgi:ubiquinol-cytochrome c reductase cytochrome c subunit